MSLRPFFNKLVEDSARNLQNQSILINGVTIHGAPQQPAYGFLAFGYKRKNCTIWESIPEDTQILITHGPAFGVLDEVEEYPHNFSRNEGCEALKAKINSLKSLKLHICGHIHSGYGTAYVDGVTYVNAAVADDQHKPINKPITIELRNGVFEVVEE